MLDAKPCPRCGENVHFIIERIPYRFTDIAVIHCKTADTRKQRSVFMAIVGPIEPSKYGTKFRKILETGNRNIRSALSSKGFNGGLTDQPSD